MVLVKEFLIVIMFAKDYFYFKCFKVNVDASLVNIVFSKSNLILKTLAIPRSTV